jgi:hypothetical protein
LPIPLPLPLPFAFTRPVAILENDLDKRAGEEAPEIEF